MVFELFDRVVVDPGKAGFEHADIVLRAEPAADRAQRADDKLRDRVRGDAPAGVHKQRDAVFAEAAANGAGICGQVADDDGDIAETELFPAAFPALPDGFDNALRRLAHLAGLVDRGMELDIPDLHIGLFKRIGKQVLFKEGERAALAPISAQLKRSYAAAAAGGDPVQPFEGKAVRPEEGFVRRRIGVDAEGQRNACGAGEQRSDDAEALRVHHVRGVDENVRAADGGGGEQIDQPVNEILAVDVFILHALDGPVIDQRKIGELAAELIRKALCGGKLLRRDRAALAFEDYLIAFGRKSALGADAGKHGELLRTFVEHPADEHLPALRGEEARAYAGLGEQPPGKPREREHGGEHYAAAEKNGELALGLERGAVGNDEQTLFPLSLVFGDAFKDGPRFTAAGSADYEFDVCSHTASMDRGFRSL